MSVNTKNWQELKKPSSLDVKTAGDAKRKATFVAEPLERGFGLTLGNALRRVLLSSLQGAAITSIKIENVLHEFSSLAGVREEQVDLSSVCDEVVASGEMDAAIRAVRIGHDVRSIKRPEKRARFATPERSLRL